MSNNFFQSRALRAVLMFSYQTYARLLFWRKGPRIFVNSIPKAGTHLVTTILEEVPGIMLSRLHIDPWDVDRQNLIHRPLKEFELDADKFKKYLGKIRGGQVVTAHFPWRPEIVEILEREGFKTFFIQRNPDDIANSRFHYIKELRRHFLHRRLVTEYRSEAEQRQALVDGIPWTETSPGTEPMAEYFEQFEGWKSEHPAINQLEFEALVGARGGGSDKQRHSSLKLILETIGKNATDQEIQKLDQRSLLKKSATLRSGKIGRSK